MAPELRDNADEFDPIDESTARVERLRAEERLREADTESQRTADAAARFSEIVSSVHQLHLKNDFTRRIRESYRGAVSHA